MDNILDIENEKTTIKFLKEHNIEERQDLTLSSIRFKLLNGSNNIRLIERLRLMEVWSDDQLTNQEKFDFAFDITMQKLEGHTIAIYWYQGAREVILCPPITITSRYMELSDIPIFRDCPVIVKWLVHFAIRDELMGKQLLLLWNYFALEQEEKDEPLKQKKKK